MGNLYVWLGEAAHCWGKIAASSPLPGDLRPGQLLVVLQSPENPLTAYHRTKTTKISEKCSDRDIMTETTSACFHVVSGGALAHVCSKTSLYGGVCSRAKMCTSRHAYTHTHSDNITDFPQRSCALTGKVKVRRGGGLAVENGGEFYDPCSLSSCKNHTSRFPALQHHRLCSQ